MLVLKARCVLTLGISQAQEGQSLPRSTRPHDVKAPRNTVVGRLWEGTKTPRLCFSEYPPACSINSRQLRVKNGIQKTTGKLTHRSRKEARMAWTRVEPGEVRKRVRFRMKSQCWWVRFGVWRKARRHKWLQGSEWPSGCWWHLPRWGELRRNRVELRNCRNYSETKSRCLNCIKEFKTIPEYLIISNSREA